MSSETSAPLLGGNGVDDALTNPDAKTGWVYELKVLMALSGPAIFQLAGQQGLVVTNQARMRCGKWAWRGMGLQRRFLISHIINCAPYPASALQEGFGALQIIVGHVGPVELAAAAIGESRQILWPGRAPAPNCAVQRSAPESI